MSKESWDFIKGVPTHITEEMCGIISEAFYKQCKDCFCKIQVMSEGKRHSRQKEQVQSHKDKKEHSITGNLQVVLCDWEWGKPCAPCCDAHMSQGGFQVTP